jgi:hypothetical protein
MRPYIQIHGVRPPIDIQYVRMAIFYEYEKLKEKQQIIGSKIFVWAKRSRNFEITQIFG